MPPGDRGTRQLRKYLREVLAEVRASRRPPRVAVLTGEDTRLARALQHELGEAARIWLTHGSDPVERHALLAGAGPWDLIVDGGATSATEVERFSACFLHLRRAGQYVVLGRPRGSGERLAALLERLARKEPTGDRERTLAGAVETFRAGPGHVVVTRRGRTLAKLGERGMVHALAVDPSRGTVLTTLPGEALASRCVVRTSGRPSMGRARERYDAPALFAREYYGVTCRPKSVVLQRGVLCPETFRHPAGSPLSNRVLRDAGPLFAFAPPRRGRPDVLPGTYFHLDNEIRGFYGHALTEQVSRLWAWPEARARFPGIKVLVSLNRGRPLAGWEFTLLEAAGIAPDAVEVIAGPTRVERLVSASPMFSMPDYIHPRITETWDAMGAALRARASDASRPSRIFCSRRHDKRPCTNRAQVEALFSEHGFTVVFPEEMPLPDQVAMFHDAEVVAGFAGSGMFTTLFSDRAKHVVLISPDTYGPSNEHMIGAVRGHRLDIAVAASDHREQGRGALRAPFTVDMSEEGVWIEQVLRSL